MEMQVFCIHKSWQVGAISSLFPFKTILLYEKILDIYVEHKSGVIKLSYPVLTFSFMSFNYSSRCYSLKLSIIYSTLPHTFFSLARS